MYLKRKFIFPALSLLILVSACGYRFAASGDLPERVQSIFIPIFKNRTSETGVEKIITDDIIYEFTRNKKDILAAGSDSSDAVLNGVVHSISVETISHIDPQTSSERRVKVAVNLKLVASGGKVIWSRKGVNEKRAYDVESDNKHRTEQNRREAISELSKRLAEKIYNMMTDNF